jgi:hypothetical protein
MVYEAMPMEIQYEACGDDVDGFTLVREVYNPYILGTCRIVRKEASDIIREKIEESSGRPPKLIVGVHPSATLELTPVACSAESVSIQHAYKRGHEMRLAIVLRQIRGGVEDPGIYQDHPEYPELDTRWLNGVRGSISRERVSARSGLSRQSLRLSLLSSPTMRSLTAFEWRTIRVSINTSLQS